MLSGQKTLSSFDKKHPCIFVLSTGRVGTETLSALLDLCPNLLSFHEPRPLLYKMSKSSFQNGMTNCEKIWDDSFMSLRADLLESALASGVGYTETSPQSTFMAPAISRVIPGAKFIHLVRHPADVVRSGMRRGWYAGHSADSTRITPKEDCVVSEHWSEMSQFEKNTWLWSETNKWIYQYTSSLPEDKYLFLKAEDIYNGNREILEQVFKFCGAEYPEEKKINKILSKKYNRQSVGKFPEFDQWSSTEVDELKNYVGETAELMGYELKK